MDGPAWGKITVAHPFPNRRQLLQRAGAGCLGLNLGTLWRAQAAHAARPSAGRAIKSCVLIFYYGGPSHLDTFDLKPAAPAEVRGEFKPTSTTVPGLQICEHLPRIARVMHKLAVVRSLHHSSRLHDSAAIHTLTGRPLDGPDRELFAPTPQFFPSHGSALSYLRKNEARDVPFACLPFAFHNVIEVPCQGAGFLGAAHNPLRIEVDPDTRSYRTDALQKPADLPPRRLHDRRDLLHALEQIADRHSRAASPLRPLYEKAYRLLDSEAVRNALDLNREPPQVRERYGLGTDAVPPAGGGNGAEFGFARAMRGQNLLLARRLVEAGVPFVNIHDFRQQGQNWDAHAQNFRQHRDFLLPAADRSLSTLVEDLDQRGLLETTLVVALGEFGRTPKINPQARRDHWPDCYSAVLAGGGVQGGAVYGSSDKCGAFPASDPVCPGDLAATIFWRFGLDPATEIHDATGRPYRLAEGEPLRKLFSV
jgi:hypothetical protein